jgi:hypothetical protein
VDRQIPGRPFQQRLARRPGSFHKLIRVRNLFDCLGKEIIEASPGFFADFMSDPLAGCAGGLGNEHQPENPPSFRDLVIVNFLIIPLRSGNS